MNNDVSKIYEVSIFEAAPTPEPRLSRFLKNLPGRDFALNQLKYAEQRLLHEIKHRLDLMEPTEAEHTLVDHSTSGQLSARLSELLENSQIQTREQAEYNYFYTILESLVPDQARILSALSEGTGYPLIHVEAGTRFVWTHYAVECVSSVGKNCGVQCSDLTHIYVQHLRNMGLVRIEPVEHSQTMKYEILETEPVVRKVLEQLKKNGQRSRIIRHTLRISDFGERLWAACQR
ncbi:Abi-alpha family protein [Aquirhabdus parva]|uniref:DUF4393 domain-containing protein n=1 Tax=Aquirhabdus parva TaxID=2283318 RepID=A0A345P2Q6_9GAMM|nr:Abi-alpha family protein [Aquirhabdus parva]AXI01565.1 DUF4393 domain-containing protein [Aquirhabdus parva]